MHELFTTYGNPPLETASVEIHTAKFKKESK